MNIPLYTTTIIKKIKTNTNNGYLFQTLTTCMYLLHCTYTLFIYYTNNKLQLEYILYVTKNNEEEEEE